MITFNLWELDQQAARIAAAEADYRARQLFERLQFDGADHVGAPAPLPVAIVVPRGRRGWRR